MDLQIKKIVQNQLRQFLKSFRNEKNISAEDAASDVGMEITSYRKLEGNKPDNRVISSVSYLAKIADIKQTSVVEFVSYLLPNDRHVHESGRQYYKWESEILAIFETMGISSRNRLIKNLATMDPETRAIYFEIFSILSKTKEAHVVSLSKIVRGLKNE